MRSIADAPWLGAATTRAVMAALEAARPGGARFVGGCVRNTLMGAPVDDIDIATQLRPDQVLAAAKRAGLVAVPTGIEHGTITVIADHVPHEVTTLRRDVETDGRRATVAFTENWEEDAARRDFRINALYAGADGALYDPTGGGLEDVRAGRVIFIGDAETRIREDYLRILRFFRFNAWYGRGPLEAAGVAACAALRGGLAGLSAERVWKESKKLIAAPDPRAALTAMEESGVRAALWPECTRCDRLARLVEIEHALGSGADAMQRLAAMIASAPAAQEFARRLKLSNEEKARLAAALTADVGVRPSMPAPVMRRAIYRLGLQAFRDRALCAWAEAGEAQAPDWRALLEAAEAWPAPVFPLTGHDAIAAGAAPGPAMGQALRAVEAWWIDADFPDDRAALLVRLKEALA
ncbi:MAG: CCA tRNA nucleotidyltransferase [Hyphomonadaceae bacterium]